MTSEPRRMTKAELLVELEAAEMLRVYLELDVERLNRELDEERAFRHAFADERDFLRDLVRRLTPPAAPTPAPDDEVPF